MAADAASFRQDTQLDRAVAQFSQEETDLWAQLRRRRDFTDRIAEKRAQLAALQERRRGYSAGHAQSQVSISLLEGELVFKRQQEREIERDIAVLRESNRILQGTHAIPASVALQLNGGTAAAPGGQDAAAAAAGQLGLALEVPGAVQDIIDQGRERQEAVQLEHEQIAHLRSHIDRLVAEKQALQTRQQDLFEKIRGSEQDRNRLLSALQDDRRAINELRQHRLALWEERCRMEREITDIVHNAVFRAAPGARSRWAEPPQRQAHGASAVAAGKGPAGMAAPTDAKLVPVYGGVRVPATSDTPAAFGERATADTAGLTAEGANGLLDVLDAPLMQRPHWTHFDGSAADNPGSSPAVATAHATVGRATAAASPLGALACAPNFYGPAASDCSSTTTLDPTSGIPSSLQAGASAGTIASALHSGIAHAATAGGVVPLDAGSITEWAPRLQEYKAQDARTSRPALAPPMM